MSLVEDWSVRIAQEVAPQEVELAGLWGEAFAAGGDARRQLLAKPARVPGAFDAAGVGSMMPLVLSSLSAAAPYVLTALSSKALGEFVGCVKNALTVLELREKRAGTGSKPAPPAQPQPLVPPQDAYAPLRGVLDTMSRELHDAGLTEDRANLVTFQVLKVLLQNPAGAQQFVQQVSASA